VSEMTLITRSESVERRFPVTIALNEDIWFCHQNQSDVTNSRGEPIAN